MFYKIDPQNKTFKILKKGNNLKKSHLNIFFCTTRFFLENKCLKLQRNYQRTTSHTQTAARASSAKQSVTINLNFWCNFSLNFLSSCTFFIAVLFGVSSTTASVLARGINQSELGDNGFDTATITTSNVEDDIEDEITAETQTVTVPITICIMIMIG